MVKKIITLILTLYSLCCLNAFGNVIELNCERSKIVYSLSKFGIPFKIKSLPTVGNIEYDEIINKGDLKPTAFLLRKVDSKTNFTSRLKLFRKAINYDKYPYFSFLSDIKRPILIQNNKEIAVDGYLNFHGVVKKVSVKLLCKIEKGNIYFNGHLNIKMTDFDIKPPKILFITIDDLIKTKFELCSNKLPSNIGHLIE